MPLTGAQLKEIGQGAAAHANYDWAAVIRREFDRWLARRPRLNGKQIPFAMEEFRMHCDRQKRIPQPTSNACWGALTTALRREGRIVATGKYRNAISPRTHAHPVPLYVEAA